MVSSMRLSVAIMFDRLSKQIMNFSVVVVVVVWLLHRPVIAFVPSSNVWCNDKPNIIFKKTTTATASPRRRRRNPPTLISGTSRDDTLNLFLRQPSSSSSQSFGDDDDKDKVINERIASSSRRMGRWNSQDSAGNKMTTISDGNKEEEQQQGTVMDMYDDDELQQEQEQQQLVNRASLSSWKKTSLVYLGLLGCCMPLRKLRSIRVSLVSIYLITPFVKKRNSMTKLARISIQAFWILYCINIPLLEVYFICRTYFDNKKEESIVKYNIPLARSRRSRRRETVLISLLYVFATCSAIFKEKGSLMLLGMLFVFRLLSYLRSSGDGNGSYSPWWAKRIIEVVDDTFNGILAII